MKILEPFLKEGNVYIGVSCGHLLVAWFIGNDKKEVSVFSDRGVDHLLMLLVGEITSNPLIIQEANEKYNQSLSSMMPVCEKVRILECSYTKLSYSMEQSKYRVYFKRDTVPTLNSIPGIYRKEAYGFTLEEAFAAAMNATPELLK